MIKKIFAVVFVLSFANTAHADFPSCEYATSDIDGDGYGYENDETCRVTQDTSTDPQPGAMVCVDDNADGWGWDGEGSCQVDIPQTSCVDTAPVGDGWGWDGVTSCRVVEYNEPVNELKIIEQHLIDIPNQYPKKAAGVYCPATGTRAEVTYHLLYDGGLRRNVGSFGLWSTGISTTDGWVRLTTHRYSDFGAKVDRLYFEGDSVSRGYFNNLAPCVWLTE